MIRVLFVDDEPDLLAGLENALRRYRTEWVMRFAVGGVAALQHLAEERCDVVVSDLRMPNLSGDALLHLVSQCYPDTLRLILSGNAERDRTADIACYAHQYLPKPSDPEALYSAITRAVAIRDRLSNPQLLSLVNEIGALPVAPRTYRRIVAADEAAGSLDDVVAIVAEDPLLANRVVHVARACLAGTRLEDADLSQAVAHLGARSVQGASLAADLVTAFPLTRDPASLGLHDMNLAAGATGLLARGIVRSWQAQGAGEAFCAGILHDIGAVVLASRAAGVRAAAVAEARETGVRLEMVEHARWGTTHADLGAFTLSRWGLPQLVVEAVLRHHDPGIATIEGNEVALAVHLAAGLVAEALEDGRAATHLDVEYLESLGLAGDLTTLREMSARAIATAERAPQ